MIVIGIDPSMANTALVAIKDGKVIGSKLIETEPTKIKSIRVSSDTISRCRKIHKGVFAFLHEHSPEDGLNYLIIGETPSGSQGQRAAVGYGIVSMLFACLGHVIEVEPDEVKVAATGTKTASKKDMIAWAYEKHPEADWDLNKNGSLKNKNEHLADAIAVVYAGLALPEVQRILQFNP